MKAQRDETDVDEDTESIKLFTLSEPSSTFLRGGSDFRIRGDFQDPHEVIRHSCDFDSIILILSNLKYADDGEKFHSDSYITNEQRERAKERDEEVTKMRDEMEAAREENAKIAIEEQCCEMLKVIGPPWNWLHNFASHNCHFKSYNFLEQSQSFHSDMTPDENDDCAMVSGV